MSFLLLDLYLKEIRGDREQEKMWNIILHYLVPVYTTHYNICTSIEIECAYWDSIMKK